jgi:hypothetical protein
MRSTSLYLVLLTVTVLLSIAFNLTRGIKTELALIAAACLVMPIAAIGLTVLRVVVAARV